jgi:hypothetical protein
MQGIEKALNMNTITFPIPHCPARADYRGIGRSHAPMR